MDHLEHSQLTWGVVATSHLDLIQVGMLQTVLKCYHFRTQHHDVVTSMRRTYLRDLFHVSVNGK